MTEETPSVTLGCVSSTADAGPREGKDGFDCKCKFHDVREYLRRSEDTSESVLFHPVSAATEFRPSVLPAELSPWLRGIILN